MPLVRYRTGDRGRFIKERCACSGELLLMEKIRRRVDGGISIGGKEFYINDFDEMFFSCDKVADYNLEFRKGRLSVEITTANDLMKNLENTGPCERLTKRRIISGDEDEIEADY
jgi:phenylacetate-coenzyme A ligase PaaK-like adenylate-forming protein